MNSDAHDEMIAAFEEYFACQTRFEYSKSKPNFAGTKARIALSKIRDCANIRRDEIREEWVKRKAARKGIPGRIKRSHK